MFYWKLKTFKNFESMERWVKRNSYKYQIRQVFLNSSYGVEYKNLIRM